MTIQHSVAVRNARLDVIETVVGASPKLRFRTGAQPASCAASRTGTILCTIDLPSDWAAAAANGIKSMLGTWAGVGAAAAGLGTSAGHFELMDSTATTCHEQGSITATGGGGDLTLDNISIAENQAVAVTGWTLTDGNA